MTAEVTADRAALEVRLDVAEQMLDLAAAVGREASVAEILDTLFAAFVPIVPFDRMEYASVSDDGAVLTTRWVRTTYDEVVLDVGFRFRRSTPPDEDPVVITGTAAPYIETDTMAYADSRPQGHPSRLLLEEGIRSGLCCPLVTKGRRVGYLFFCSRTPNAYDDFHLWVLTHIAGIASGAIFTGELRDELARRNRELEELTRFRTRYLATVSHELRTPLTAVLGLARTLSADFPDLDQPEARELLTLLTEQSEDSATIVEDLLLLARSEAGELRVARERVEVEEAVRSVVAQVAPGAPVRGSAMVVGDPARIRQILRNLLTNAVRYGGPSVKVDIEGNGSRAEVLVCDDGFGIPEAHRRAIFEPFGRVGGDEVGSVGIGLWVSSELAARMGGSLEYSYADGWSRFVLSLPLAG